MLIISWSKVLKLIGFVLLLPALIGHGLGTSSIDTTSACTKDGSNCDIFYMSGGEDPSNVIKFGNNLAFSFLNRSYRWTRESQGETISAQQLIESPENRDNAFLELSQNSPLGDPMTATVGELWLHKNDGKKLKLIHNASMISYVDVAFSIHALYFSGDDISPYTGEGFASGYRLSSSSSGDSGIEIAGTYKLKLNGESIYSCDNILGCEKEAPFFVDALPGDSLSILINGFGNFSQYSLPLWLHSADGSRTKLLESIARSEYNIRKGVLIDLTFQLP